MSAGAPSSSLPPPRAASLNGSSTYLERLAARVEHVGTTLCLGIDPDPQALPRGFTPDCDGVEGFARLLIEAASPYAAAVKVNLAFFEAFGSDGVAALERIRAVVQAEIPFIADAKRGDIASTAARQATALFDALGADAITVNPYLGREALAPFLERSDRFVYVLCRTSNLGAGEFQSLRLDDGEPLYVRVARHAASWWDSGDQVGLVVGATAPAELTEIREVAPELPFLVPGVGAQGGDVEAVTSAGPARTGAAAARPGSGLLVNLSRGIASAALESADPGTALARAAEGWAQQLHI